MGCGISSSSLPLLSMIALLILSSCAKLPFQLRCDVGSEVGDAGDAFCAFRSEDEVEEVVEDPRVKPIIGNSTARRDCPPIRFRGFEESGDVGKEESAVTWIGGSATKGCITLNDSGDRDSPRGDCCCCGCCLRASAALNEPPLPPSKSARRNFPTIGWRFALVARIGFALNLVPLEAWTSPLKVRYSTCSSSELSLVNSSGRTRGWSFLWTSVSDSSRPGGDTTSVFKKSRWCLVVLPPLPVPYSVMEGEGLAEATTSRRPTSESALISSKIRALIYRGRQ